jgi:type IV fimbrial biogenesis protein FimT
MWLPNRRVSGYSLVEMIIAIAIIGILAAMAIPSYRIWVQNNRIRNAAESIQTGIQMARAEAVNRNVSVQFDLRGVNSAWTVCVSPAIPGSCPNPDDVSTVQSRAISEGSSADIIVTPNVASPYVFNGLGVLTPSPAAGAVTIGVDTTALPAGTGRALRIVIGVGGSSRMCDPALPASDSRSCP